MDNREYEKITDNLINFIPIFRGIFMKICEKDKSANIFKSQYPILGVLKRNGPMHMSEIGSLLGISKANMTCLVDKLIEENKVRRLADKSDRRIVRIEITEKGRNALTGAKHLVKEEFKRKLSILSQNDITELSYDLENIKKIVSKISEEKI